MRTSLLIAALILQGHAEPEIHLIPAGYVGYITIVFQAANGEPLQREGDARLYKISANGILLTQAGPNVGISPVWKFFVVTPQGERTPITRITASTVPDTPENRASSGVEVFYPRRGAQQAGRVPCRIQFDQYFVGSRAQLLARTAADNDADRRRLSDFLERAFACQ
jgi:hypothetical protein